MTMDDIFRKIIIQNELGGNISLIYKFSDADGIRKGKSGYSFGISQFDILNNTNAILCLRECDFTTDEIKELKEQIVNKTQYDKRLKEHYDIVDKWDEKQLNECLEHSISLCDFAGIKLKNRKTLYHLADYHNQFYFSKYGKMYKYLLSLGRIVNPEDILALKMKTTWGKSRPDDVRRRYNNITKILKAENAL